MNLDKAIKNVSVIGASGKMGRGIAELCLIEMAKRELKTTGRVGSGAYLLNLIDRSSKDLFLLRSFLRSQVQKFAEKNINFLREGYAGHPLLVSNKDIIETFVLGVNDMVRIDTKLEWAFESSLVFEAIKEDVETKVSIFKQLKEKKQKPCFYFTNTSSIPISVLDEKAHLEGDLMGFHFYNPPPLQRVVELAAAQTTKKEAAICAADLAKAFNKTAVYSGDVAGFIGNGYLMREIVFASNLVKRLSQEMSEFEAIYLTDIASKEFLLRPMGIFQLIDYIGIDVCKQIMDIMKTYLKEETLSSSLIEQILSHGIKGGQKADLGQKNGFFQYDSGHRIKGVYHLAEKYYQSIYEEGFSNKIEAMLGKKPYPFTWKDLKKDPEREEKIRYYFAELKNQQTLGACLAGEFLEKDLEIAKILVQTGAAKRIEDVDTVLMQGFNHLYRSAI